MEELLNSFHLNSHTLGLYVQIVAPCKSLNSATWGIGQAGDQDGWVLVKLSFFSFWRFYGARGSWTRKLNFDSGEVMKFWGIIKLRSSKCTYTKLEASRSSRKPVYFLLTLPRSQGRQRGSWVQTCHSPFYTKEQRQPRSQGPISTFSK